MSELDARVPAGPLEHKWERAKFELRRAATYGMMTVIQRYRVSIIPHVLERDAA